MRSASSEARRRLSEQAADWVRAAVISGSLKTGEQVRPEDVGRHLGISATPAREGLQALRVEGFLTVEGRRGFVVLPIRPADVRDLFEAQALLAGELAARTAERADDAGRAELEALHHELIASAVRRDLDQLEEKNHAFHRSLNQMAGSPKLAWALGLTTRYVPRGFYAAIPGWPEATVSDHGQVLASVQAHDAAASRAAMEHHVRRAGELLAQHVERRSTDRTGDSSHGASPVSAQAPGGQET